MLHILEWYVLRFWFTPYLGQSFSQKCCDRLLETYEVLREAYRPLFSTIIWTGDSRPEDLPGDEVWVDCDGKGGTIMQACLANVMQVRSKRIKLFLKGQNLQSSNAIYVPALNAALIDDGTRECTL